jgi:hypothetical protein
MDMNAWRMCAPRLTDACAGASIAALNAEGPPGGGPSCANPGGDLLSQALEHQVPSALRDLTSLFGMGRGVSPSLWPPETVQGSRGGGLPGEHLQNSRAACSVLYKSSPRTISTGLLNTLLRLHIQPINLVVCQDPYSLKGMGELISRQASRLDAFSGYPNQT